MSLSSIKQALEVRLSELPSLLPTSWDNKPLPMTSDPHQRVNFLPAPPENPTMGDSFRREVGVMQITLSYPTNIGAGTALAMAVTLQAWFPRGSSFVANGITTTIQRTPEIGPGRTVNDRYLVPVSIRYFANIIP